jgi:hypothetical protein
MLLLNIWSSLQLFTDFSFVFEKSAIYLLSIPLLSRGDFILKFVYIFLIYIILLFVTICI